MEKSQANKFDKAPDMENIHEVRKDNLRLQKALKLIADCASGEASWYEAIKCIKPKGASENDRKPSL